MVLQVETIFQYTCGSSQKCAPKATLSECRGRFPSRIRGKQTPIFTYSLVCDVSSTEITSMIRTTVNSQQSTSISMAGRLAKLKITQGQVGGIPNLALNSILMVLVHLNVHQ